MNNIDRFNIIADLWQQKNYGIVSPGKGQYIHTYYLQYLHTGNDYNFHIHLQNGTEGTGTAVQSYINYKIPGTPVKDHRCVVTDIFTANNHKDLDIITDLIWIRSGYNDLYKRQGDKIILNGYITEYPQIFQFDKSEFGFMCHKSNILPHDVLATAQISRSNSHIDNALAFARSNVNPLTYRQWSAISEEGEEGEAGKKMNTNGGSINANKNISHKNIKKYKKSNAKRKLYKHKNFSKHKKLSKHKKHYKTHKNNKSSSKHKTKKHL